LFKLLLLASFVGCAAFSKVWSQEFANFSRGGKSNIATIAFFSFIVAQNETIPASKGMNHRLDPRMPFAKLPKFFGAFLLLVKLGSLFLLGKTRQFYNVRKLFQIHRSPKTIIITCSTYLPIESVLQLFDCIDKNFLISHHNTMAWMIGAAS